MAKGVGECASVPVRKNDKMSTTTLFFLIVTMLARHHSYPWMSAAAKAAASATFVHDAPSTFAFAGDVALAFDQNKVGTVAFAFAHLLNIWTWLDNCDGCIPLLSTWQSIVVKITLALAGFVALRLGCIPTEGLYRAYVAILLTAAHVAIVTQSATRGVGMLLFIIADIGVGMEISCGGDVVLKKQCATWQWALPLYFFAQWMIV